MDAGWLTPKRVYVVGQQFLHTIMASVCVHWEWAIRFSFLPKLMYNKKGKLRFEKIV